MANSLMKISDIKANPNNPRIIKDDKFKKLVESVKSFPEMLELRPIVVNKDMIILGGNMRFKACKEAWIKEIPVIIADNLTEEQEREFLIKDNVSGGEWDWDILANEWDKEELEEWGLDTPYLDTENMDDDFSLPDWEKWEIETVTFTLHREQNELLQEAIIISKKQGAFINTWNENWNWNALARIIETYLTQNNEC